MLDPNGGQLPSLYPIGSLVSWFFLRFRPFGRHAPSAGRGPSPAGPQAEDPQERDHDATRSSRFLVFLSFGAP